MNPHTLDGEARDREVTRPVMRVWQDSETDAVADATLDVLRICGVEVRHPRALALLAEAGAQIEGTRVRFPAELVKRALDSAPARVTVGARNSSRPLELGRGHSYFGTGPDCLYVAPSSGESRRRALVADVQAMAALCQKLEHIDFVMSMGEGYQNAHSSCRNRIVLVNQAAEEITPLDLWHNLDRDDVALLLRCSKVNAAVRSFLVVGP
jgi:trimethylamine:corrinoid methyltransferase-like protein